MFGKPNIKKIIREGDQKKLIKAVSKNPEIVMNVVRAHDWDAINKILEVKPGLIVGAIISEGDLNSLKQVISEKPDVLKMFFTEKNYTEASMLHQAAIYDRPSIIEFLVNEKGMKVDKLQKNLWTPFHFAAASDAQEAMKKLMDLGADPYLQNSDGRTSYDLCANIGTKEFLEPYRKELKKTEPMAAPADSWKSSSPDEVTHERQQECYRLTDIFNFSVEIWTSITKDLENDQFTKETKDFTETPKGMLDQARAKLTEIYGAAATDETTDKTPPTPKPAEAKKLPDYSKIIGFRKK